MLKIAICDDEPVAIKELESLITLYAGEHNLQIQQNAYASGEQLLKTMGEQEKGFDILFLDIKMNQINGIETAKIIRQANESIIIIFVSALHEYIFDAFDVEAKGFIVKPIQKQKIYEVLDKSRAKLEQSNRRSLHLYHCGQHKKIPFKDICYCEVQGHAVFVYELEKMNQYQGNLDTLEKELDNEFFRCHRSYIVNLRFIESYQNHMIFMQSGEKIPVAGRRQKQFMKALLHFQRNAVR